MSGGGSRDYRVIARAVLAELADSLRMHKTNPRYIWNVGIEERALAVPLLELGQNVFGITLEEQVRGDPKTLEASVNANYKIDLKLTEPVPPFDERAY
ncbi:hypothetical protein HYS48_01575, partial [Candidatus Woesearchaeota archaeon]|nr:hypothetical protein [Candidatus Woesearchaeota archaeon]